MAQILGIEPQSASVTGDETTQGRVLAAAARWTRPEIVIDGRTEMRLHREIMVCFAGVLAERRLVGRLNRIRASKDYEVAAAIAMYATTTTEEANALLAWLQTRTDNLVDRNWRIIEVVAAALTRTMTLDHAQIVTIMQSAVGCHATDGTCNVAPTLFSQFGGPFGTV